MALQLNNYVSSNFGTVSSAAYVRLLTANMSYADGKSLSARIEVGIYNSQADRNAGLLPVDCKAYDLTGNDTAPLITPITDADAISPRDVTWTAVYDWLKTRAEFANAIDC